jgi:ATP-dependent Clp protease ATP-binding subunit ClpA
MVDAMEEFPVSLDTLITFVRAIQPEGDALSHLSDAVRVSKRVDEKADALIGYFVDEARRSGAPWSQIGESMGVSKQAVQKRFVGRGEDDRSPEERFADRMPPRARHALRMSRRLAALDDNATQVEPRHLVGALVAENLSVAAIAAENLGVSVDSVFEAFALPPLPDADDGADPDADDVTVYAEFGRDAKKVIAGGLDIALHYAHNYVGTEHIILSAATDSSASETMAALGLGPKPLHAEIDKLLKTLPGKKPTD